MIKQIREWIDACKRDIRKAKAELHDHFRRHGLPHPAHESRFTFFINNLKFSAMETPQLTVPSGTSVKGLNEPFDSANDILPASAYKAGSCKYSVVAGPSGKAPGFSVAPGATEEECTVTETTPGSDSDGQINFDAQDVDGNQLPTSSAILTFTAPPPPPPPLVVGSKFILTPDTPATAGSGTATNS